MANDNKEIGDIVKKCKILLLDIEGTTTSISFVKDKLFPYAEDNVKEFLDSQWETSDVKEAVDSLRKLAVEDDKKSVEGLVAIPGEDASKEDQIQGLVNNVKWQMSSDRKVGPLKHLQGLIWKQGFDKGDIKGHVYDDVSAALEQWHGVEGQKIYIYSSGSVQAQKLLFEKSLAGDLLPFIDGHFDTSVGPKQEVASYTAIVEKIGSKADEILFLTDIPKEAEAARSAGMHAALVSREGNAPLTSEATDAFAVIHSFAQLTTSNKRKTDPQDEQPAKVPKTETSNDVKETVETKTSTDKASEASPNVEKAKEESEKMDVDEESAPAKEESKEEKQEKPAVVVEEITDSNEIDVPISDVEPVVTEASDKPEENEKMETDSADKSEPAKEVKEKEASESVQNDKNVEKTEVPKENGDKPVEEKAPIAEETPPTVITEIEEITADKENLAETAEIIDDIVPVVEEPKSGEVMEDLENAGQELEKECADILTKVETVTNLDNILIKQSLKTIAEESTESDNEPLISETILQKEIAIEMKHCEQITSNLTESINPKPKVLKKDRKAKVEHAKDEAESNKEKSDTAQEKIEPVVEKKTSEDETAKPVDKTDSVKEKEESVKEQQTEAAEVKADKPSSMETNTDDEKVEESNVKIEITPEETSTDKESEAPAEKQVETPTEKPVETSTETSAETPVETSVEKPAASETPTDSNSKDADLPMETDETKTTTDESTESSTQDKPNNTTETIEATKTGETMECSSEQVNGKTNGEAEINLNGDASNDGLSSRLSVENGKEVNGANGDSVEAEKKEEDKKEADIKVKSVSTEERTEPVEQPTEA